MAAEKKKLMLIINPAAGRGGYKQGFTEALKILNDGGYRTTLFYTAGARDATEYAGRYAHDFDAVACIGGDGTLSEVIAGLMRVPSPPPLGYIPMGTANDVATTLGLPKNDTIGAALRLVRGHPPQEQQRRENRPVECLAPLPRAGAHGREHGGQRIRPHHIQPAQQQRHAHRHQPRKPCPIKSFAHRISPPCGQCMQRRGGKDHRSFSQT